ncbi:hypothetical protein K492DRAFT_172850 [Lichtheimia hyalospora FSU 10163]|nr:hypothetical protein K492DRAFT_172850 [Lichtheimia hyalospora FSU 10163]
MPMDYTRSDPESRIFLVRKVYSFILGMSSSNGDEHQLEPPSSDPTSPTNEQVACTNSEDKATTHSLIDDSQRLTPDQPRQTTDVLQEQLQQSDVETIHESMEEPIVSPAYEVTKPENESSIQDTEE